MVKICPKVCKFVLSLKTRGNTKNLSYLLIVFIEPTSLTSFVYFSHAKHLQCSPGNSIKVWTAAHATIHLLTYYDEHAWPWHWNGDVQDDMITIQHLYSTSSHICHSISAVHHRQGSVQPRPQAKLENMEFGLACHFNGLYPHNPTHLPTSEGQKAELA